MHAALHTAHTAAGHQAALDGYLAGLMAYVTFIGLRGHANWRPAFLTGLGLYGLATLADGSATVLSLLITVLIGSAIGSGLRYATRHHLRPAHRRRPRGRAEHPQRSRRRHAPGRERRL